MELMHCKLLMAIGVGQWVIFQFSYIATAEATALLGAKPVYVDVDPKTFNIVPHQIEEKINDNTKAIIPYHFMVIQLILM